MKNNDLWILIVVILASLLKYLFEWIANKKKTLPEFEEGTPEESSPLSINTKKTKRASSHEEKYARNNRTASANNQQGSRRNDNDTSFKTSNSDRSNPLLAIKTREELRKAVIMAEIINRKY